MADTLAMKTAAALCAAMLAAGAAEANPGKGRGAGKAPARDDRSGVSADIGVSIHIGDDERRIVREHYAGAGHCPPGLAKKRNGCLPPGQAKKRYRVGHRIPDDSIVVELPYGVVVSLPGLPHGHGYRLVDGDLAVVDLHTHIVIDAGAIF